MRRTWILHSSFVCVQFSASIWISRGHISPHYHPTLIYILDDIMQNVLDVLSWQPEDHVRTSSFPQSQLCDNPSREYLNLVVCFSVGVVAPTECVRAILQAMQACATNNNYPKLHSLSGGWQTPTICCVCNNATSNGYHYAFSYSKICSVLQKIIKSAWSSHVSASNEYHIALRNLGARRLRPM